MSRSLRTKLWAAAGPRNPAQRATKRTPVILGYRRDTHPSTCRETGSYQNLQRRIRLRAHDRPADYGTGNGTGETFAVLLRPGNKGANSAKDHIEALSQALTVLPDDFYDTDGVLIGEKLLVRTASVGASREFLNHLDALGIQFSTSYSLPVIKERQIQWISEMKYWEPAIDQHGKPLRDVWVVDATKIMNLKDYPPGTRIYVRAEPLHSGAKASLFDADGNRITAFLTNSPYYVIPELDRRHRARERCENRIKSLKHAGLGKLPYWLFAANQAWALIAALVTNLLAWMQLVILPASHEAGVWDVKRWRYRLFGMVGKLISSGRRTRLLIPAHDPESRLLGLMSQT